MRLFPKARSAGDEAESGASGRGGKRSPDRSERQSGQQLDWWQRRCLGVWLLHADSARACGELEPVGMLSQVTQERHSRSVRRHSDGKHPLRLLFAAISAE